MLQSHGVKQKKQHVNKRRLQCLLTCRCSRTDWPCWCTAVWEELVFICQHL